MNQFVNLKTIVDSVFSPGCGLMGFLQENLRWHIKSQEDVPIRVQRHAMSQTDFRTSTVN